MDHPTRRLDANDPELPPPQRPCYECGGRMVQATFRAGYDLQLFNQGTRPFSGKSSEIQTLVCLECGALRLYAEHPAKLDPAATR